MLEDLYSNDLIGDPRTLEEEEDGSGALLWDEERENRADDSGDNENGVPEFDVAQTLPQGSQPVEPKKKKVVRNPQPKLNPDRLKGPRGIAILEDVFKTDFKFSGKGYEKRDLNQVMKRLEHWAHRLFPKFQFDDCLEKIETLGHKKPVLTYVKRIRMGLETAEMASALELPIDEQNVLDDDVIPDLLSDPFDDLLSQQIAQSQPRSQQPVDHPHSQSPSPVLQPPKMSLTEEQKERMRRNRLIAEQRLMARFKAVQQNQTSDDLLTSPDGGGNFSAMDNSTDFRTCTQREQSLNTLSQQPVDREKSANTESSQSEGNMAIDETADFEASWFKAVQQNQISDDLLMSPDSGGNSSAVNNATNIRTCTQGEQSLNTLSQQLVDREKSANTASSQPEGNLEIDETADFEASRFKAVQQNQTSDDLLMSADSGGNSSSVDNATDIRTCTQGEQSLNTLSQQPVDGEKSANTESSQPEGNIEIDETADFEACHQDQGLQRFSEQSAGNKRPLNEESSPPETNLETGDSIGNGVHKLQDTLEHPSEKEAVSYNQYSLAQEGTADNEIHLQNLNSLQTSSDQSNLTPTNPKEGHLSSKEMEIEVSTDNETCSPSLKTVQISADYADQHQGKQNEEFLPSIGKMVVEEVDDIEMQSENQQMEEPAEEKSVENADVSPQEDKDKVMEVTFDM